MNITILNVTPVTKPGKKPGTSYQALDVAFKNNTFQGKVEGKQIFSFGANKPAFDVLSTAQPNQSFEVTVVKNDAGYNDWVSVQPAGAGAVSPVPAAPLGGSKPGFTGGSTAGVPARSSYETPEERAQRQVYIIRQSSISSAIATLVAGAKKLESDDVLKLATKYTDFVLGRGATGFEDVPDFPAEIYEPVSVS